LRPFAVGRWPFAASIVLALSAGCSTPAAVEDPETLSGLLRKGQEAETRGDGIAAGSAYEQAVRDFPDQSSSWAAFGEHRRFWQRDSAAAEVAFRKAIDAPRRTRDSVAFAWRGLGEIERGRGQVDRAIECFTKSLSVSPSTEAYRSLSALFATEKRDFETARHYAGSALKQSPDDPIALLQYAVQMVRFKKPKEADEAFAKAVRLAGCDENGRSNGHVHCCVLYNGACYHAVRGNKAGALAMLKEFFMTPNHRHITKDEILKDPDFESLAKDPDFQALLEYRLPVE
jgi:tetratricopeptide (TPR) repeat protein